MGGWSWIWSQPKQHSETLSQHKLNMRPAQARKFTKIMKANRARGVAQVVEHLPDNCKALSSNHNTTWINKELAQQMKLEAKSHSSSEVQHSEPRTTLSEMSWLQRRSNKGILPWQRPGRGSQLQHHSSTVADVWVLLYFVSEMKTDLLGVCSFT
jgi:glutamate-1-semialdehyde aminotransferase